MVELDANLGTVTNSGTLDTSGNAAAGARILVFVWWFGTMTLTSGSWGGGLTWVVDHQFRGTTGSDQNVGIASADCPSGWTSGTDIVPTFTATPSFGPGIAAASFTGLAGGSSGYLDDTAVGVNDIASLYETNDIVTTEDEVLVVSASVADGESHVARLDGTEIHDFVAEGAQRLATIYEVQGIPGTLVLAGEWIPGVSFQNNIAAAYKPAAGAPSVILNPDADTDVAGWVTSPLFSKINDNSDATFVTDGLV